MESSLDSQARHPIGVVCRRTGLKPDLIRAWETRYGAVMPKRSETRRRLYSDADIDRLKLLRQAVSAGRGIRHVASLPRQELLDLIAADAVDAASVIGGAASAPRRLSSASAGSAEALEGLIEGCLSATRRLDENELEIQLERASVSLSRVDLMESLIVPLMRRIGDLWREGTLRPVHEHMATAVVRTFLGKLPGRQASPAAPHLLVTTPSGQTHELGGLLVAELAAGEGWQVTYLGTELPAEEIAAGCHQKNAHAVALSITYPPDDPLLGPEFQRLRRLLAPGIEILVGGRAAPSYLDLFESIGARYVPNLSELRKELERLRAMR